MKQNTKTKEYAHTEFRKSIVGFIDILGFSNEVNKISTDDIDKARKIGEILYRIKYDRRIQGFSKYGLQILAISDSIIITHPAGIVDGESRERSIEPIFRVILAALYIQQILLTEEAGFWLSRGYITEGLCYHKDDVVFGPAYVKAYREERKHPDPKIIVDQNVAEKYLSWFASKGSGSNDGRYYLIAYETGPYFVNYLNLRLIEYNVDFKKQLNVWIENALEKAQQFSAVTGVSEKYQWFIDYARYHLSKI